MQHTILRPLSSLRRYISFGELPSGHGQISVPRRTRCWICSTWWGLNDFIVSHVQSPSTHKTQTRHDLICAPAWVLALNKKCHFWTLSRTYVPPYWTERTNFFYLNFWPIAGHCLSSWTGPFLRGNIFFWHWSCWDVSFSWLYFHSEKCWLLNFLNIKWLY